MRTKHRTGTTAENNSWSLPQGMLSVDSEKHAIRLHDGVTPGGYEVMGTPALSLPPGPPSLVAGNTTTGFYGEVTSTDLITGEDLATSVGLAAGTLANNTSNWLKFSWQGTTEYISMLGIRSAVSWDDLNALGLVYGTELVLAFGTGQTYTCRIRLIRGADTDPVLGTLNDPNPSLTHQSEWDRLMYPIHQSPPRAVTSWAAYTDAQLGIGTRTWCQENESNNSDSLSAPYYLCRGLNSIGYYSSAPHGYTNGTLWRPVIEILQ